MIWHIALHEWRRLRGGLTFWLLLAIAQTVIAWLAFSQLQAFAEIAPQLKAADTQLDVMDLIIGPSLNSLLLLLLLLSPLLAMGGLASERQSGRLSLWLSTPVSSASLVAGKALGLFLGALPLLLTTLLTLATLGSGIDIAWPHFILASLFLMLALAWLACINTLLSSLFDHPAAALTASYGCLLALWLLDSLIEPTAAWYGVALLPHLTPAFEGLLRAEDAAYFLTSGAAALLMAVFRVATLRGET